jgi:hypothetical protein
LDLYSPGPGQIFRPSFGPDLPFLFIINHASIVDDGDLKGVTKEKFKMFDYSSKLFAQYSGIDVAPGINVAHGTFGKNIKRSP